MDGAYDFHAPLEIGGFAKTALHPSTPYIPCVVSQLYAKNAGAAVTNASLIDSANSVTGVELLTRDSPAITHEQSP